MNNHKIILVVLVGLLSSAMLCAMDGDVERSFYKYVNRRGSRGEPCPDMLDARELVQNMVGQVSEELSKRMSVELLEKQLLCRRYEKMEQFLSWAVENHVFTDDDAAHWYQRMEDAQRAPSSAAGASSLASSSATEACGFTGSEMLSEAATEPIRSLCMVPVRSDCDALIDIEKLRAYMQTELIDAVYSDLLAHSSDPLAAETFADLVKKLWENPLKLGDDEFSMKRVFVAFPAYGLRLRSICLQMIKDINDLIGEAQRYLDSSSPDLGAARGPLHQAQALVLCCGNLLKGIGMVAEYQAVLKVFSAAKFEYCKLNKKAKLRSLESTDSAAPREVAGPSVAAVCSKEKKENTGSPLLDFEKLQAQRTHIVQLRVWLDAANQLSKTDEAIAIQTYRKIVEHAIRAKLNDCEECQEAQRKIVQLKKFSV